MSCTVTGTWWSSIGSVWALYVGHGLMVGLLGNGGVYPPLLVYVSRWFNHRRGAAIALISSGQYVAGVVWPSLFERGIATFGWQALMLAYSAIVQILILPSTFLLEPAPVAPAPAGRCRTRVEIRPPSVQRARRAGRN